MRPEIENDVLMADSKSRRNTLLILYYPGSISRNLCFFRRPATGTGHEFTGPPVLGFPVFLAVLQNGGQCLHSFTRFAVSLDGFFDKNRTFKRKIFTGFPNMVSTMPKYGHRKAGRATAHFNGGFLDM